MPAKREADSLPQYSAMSNDFLQFLNSVESTSTPSPKKKKLETGRPQTDKPKTESTSISPKSPREIRNWTPEEDAIFLNPMLDTLKEHLFQRVKADGRLDRQNPAVRAHLVAFMNKLKKA
ncbi:hypothetical protein BCR39DRAFT_508472 [Naematelia encephala]|uniref:Uncharacterized protein n=1 Tax=Naematelia encephala TaxID=71784 RepID=A0A1Y2AET7_9TREE|nr:hypothetical protein BCR39DRAFT_508472 [Naematelia encephala]